MSLLVCSGCSTRYAPGLERCPHCKSVERTEEGGGGSRLPYLDVACPQVGCRAEGVVRRVYVRLAAPGVVEQPAMRCLPCGAVMATRSDWSTPALGGDEDMPKITVHGGASNQHDDVPERPAESEGGEESSPGNSSSTSAERPPSSPVTSGTGPPKPARTTASRSKKARAASSTAGTTDGSGEGDDA